MQPVMGVMTEAHLLDGVLEIGAVCGERWGFSRGFALGAALLFALLAFQTGETAL